MTERNRGSNRRTAAGPESPSGDGAAREAGRARPQVRKRPDREAELAPPRVLVIDDDLSVLMMVRQVLGEAGFAVEVAESGMEGVTRFHRNRPELVLLDVTMPGEDGFQVCARLKHTNPDDIAKTLRQPDGAAPKPVPVVFLTARGSMDDVQHAVRAGGDDYLRKPFTPDQLVERVVKFLGRPAPPPPPTKPASTALPPKNSR